MPSRGEWGAHLASTSPPLPWSPGDDIAAASYSLHSEWSHRQHRVIIMLFIKYVEIYARFYALNLNLFWGPRLDRLPLPINYLLYAQARSSEASLSAPCESERTLSAGRERWIWMMMRALPFDLRIGNDLMPMRSMTRTRRCDPCSRMNTRRTQPHLRFPPRTASKCTMMALTVQGGLVQVQLPLQTQATACSIYCRCDR